MLVTGTHSRSFSQVDVAISSALADSFAELRRLNDAGAVAYPFSSREAVAAMRHIASFPTDSIAECLENILSFDAHDVHVRIRVAAVFASHGIVIARSPLAVSSNAPRRPAVNLSLTETSIAVNQSSALGVDRRREVDMRKLSSWEVRSAQVALSPRSVVRTDGPFELRAPRMCGDFTALRSAWTLQSTVRSAISSTAFSPRDGGGLCVLTQALDRSSSVRYGHLLPTNLHIFSGLSLAATGDTLTLAHAMGLPPRRRYSMTLLQSLYDHHRCGGLWGLPGYTARVPPELTFSQRLGLAELQPTEVSRRSLPHWPPQGSSR